MSLSDEDIAAVLQASDVEPAELAQLVSMAGLTPTGEAIADVKAMADHLGLEIDDLLYGLFVEEQPFFDDDSWSSLTRDDQWQ